MDRTRGLIELALVSPLLAVLRLACGRSAGRSYSTLRRAAQLILTHNLLLLALLGVLSDGGRAVVVTVVAGNHKFW